MSFWHDLPRPFFALAPMDDVTDTVFRRVVASCAAPDVFFTEFASVEGFCSPGKPAVESKLRFTASGQPLAAQIWGVNPVNFYKVSKQLASRGFAGIDLNMGCPVKNVIKMGACSALINNRDLAHEIISATQDGAGKVPVSIKTRIGQTGYDKSWMKFLLEHKPAALTVHFRSVKEISKAPASWELASRIVALKNEISPDTLIVGNGDVLTRGQGCQLAEKYGLDGVMIGRGIFHDPFVFAARSPWGKMDKNKRLGLYEKHIKLFKEEWGDERNPAGLKKFAKVYINGFIGAKELRLKLMDTVGADDLLSLLETNKAKRKTI